MRDTFLCNRFATCGDILMLMLMTPLNVMEERNLVVPIPFHLRVIQYTTSFARIRSTHILAHMSSFTCSLCNGHRGRRSTYIVLILCIKTTIRKWKHIKSPLTLWELSTDFEPHIRSGSSISFISEATTTV